MAVPATKLLFGVWFSEIRQVSASILDLINFALHQSGAEFRKQTDLPGVAKSPELRPRFSESHLT